MIRYDFDPVRASAEITVSGELADADVLAWFQGFLGRLRGRKQVSGIVDTRPVTRLRVTSDAVRQMTLLAEACEDAFAGSRWAFVAASDAVFGMARMYQIIRDGAPYEIRVFREMEPACEWLDEAPPCRS
jgi:hypothetical protein